MVERATEIVLHVDHTLTAIDPESASDIPLGSRWIPPVSVAPLKTPRPVK
jgi:hypothetical protein